MIIAIDGPRGIGKTTLMPQLQEALSGVGIPSTIHKFQRVPNTVEQHFYEIIPTLRPGTVHLLDRFYLTELIFSLYHKREEPRQLVRTIGFLDTLYTALGIRTIILDANEETLLQRIEGRSDGRGFEMPVDLNRRYWSFAKMFSWNAEMMPFNSSEDCNAVIKRVVEIAQENWRKTITIESLTEAISFEGCDFELFPDDLIDVNGDLISL